MLVKKLFWTAFALKEGGKGIENTLSIKLLGVASWETKKSQHLHSNTHTCKYSS